MDTGDLLSRISTKLGAMSRLTIEIASSHSVNTADKDLLKKQCLDLYELIQDIGLREPAGKYPAKETHQLSMEEFEVKEAVLMSEIMPELTPPKTVETNTVAPPIVETAVPVAPEGVHKQPVMDAPTAKNVEENPKPPIAPPVVEPVTRKHESLNIPANEVSIHQKISHVRQPHLREKISEARIDNLKTAISLNKKIAFVNELFRENTVEYAKAIDKLNGSADLNEALRHFNELKHQYSWSNDNELVLEIEQLLQKRFR